MGRSLYYALGGGLGHLSRARAVLGCLNQNALVISSSPHAGDPILTQGLDVLPVPGEIRSHPDRLGPWLAELIRQTEPASFFLDSFPLGISGELGEIAFPPEVRIHHLARRLRWEEYAPLIRGVAPRLDLVYLLEPLEAAHLAWLQVHGRRLLPLRLSYPAVTETPALAQARQRLAALQPPHWLVVHAGPENEIRELLAYAMEMAGMEGIRPSLVLIAPSEAAAHSRWPEGVLHLPFHPARLLFPLAQRLITAGGFNIMQETIPWRGLHRVLPMPRRFDDQFARVALCRPARAIGPDEVQPDRDEAVGNRALAENGCFSFFYGEQCLTRKSIVLL